MREFHSRLRRSRIPSRASPGREYGGSTARPLTNPASYAGYPLLRLSFTQLLQLLHSWYSSLEKGDSVDVFFLDFAKAFDRVSHHHLLYKLQCYGIQGQLFSWFHDYLLDRTQRVILEVIHQNGWR